MEIIVAEETVVGLALMRVKVTKSAAIVQIGTDMVVGIVAYKTLAFLRALKQLADECQRCVAVWWAGIVIGYSRSASIYDPGLGAVYVRDIINADRHDGFRHLPDNLLSQLDQLAPCPQPFRHGLSYCFQMILHGMFLSHRGVAIRLPL